MQTKDLVRGFRFCSGLCSGNLQVAIWVLVLYARRQRPDVFCRYAMIATRFGFVRGSFRTKTSNALQNKIIQQLKTKHPLQINLPANIPKNKKPAPTSRG